MKNEYVIVKGANEQEQYTINRLNDMECKTDGDIIFQNQCIRAMYKMLGLWDVPDSK
jgi:hypothetical protein